MLGTTARGALLLTLLAGLPGCYFTQLAGGQLELINGQRALERAYADERDPERRRLLALVPDLHGYATSVVQLRPGRNYRGYYATGREGITAIVLAAERTRFEAYTWWFPIAGEVPYKSYFDEADAEAEAAELAAEGYDTWVGHATAYSTLGILRDPVTDVMMQRGLAAFVEVLFHEMAHARLYAPGHSDWNEQLASFVGQQAARDYLVSRYGAGSPELLEVEQLQARRAALEQRVSEAIEVLEALYGGGLPDAEVLRRRAPVLAALERDLRALYPELPPEELRMNNARLLQYKRYDRDSEEMRALWQRAGESWVAFWALAEQRAREL